MHSLSLSDLLNIDTLSYYVLSSDYDLDHGFWDEVCVLIPSLVDRF